MTNGMMMSMMVKMKTKMMNKTTKESPFTKGQSIKYVV